MSDDQPSPERVEKMNLLIQVGGTCVRANCDCSSRDQTFAKTWDDVPPFHDDCHCVALPMPSRDVLINADAP